jgi:WhiB family transcriptional regulator, redox-sensing transcriptional regulator
LTAVLDQSDEEPTPYQAPTLSELEEVRALGQLTAQRTVEWLMVEEDGADIETFLEQLVHRPSWHALAACRGVGVDAFVLTKRKGTWSEYDRSRCEGCAVQQTCLETALADPDLTGLWGGTTPEERKAMRRRPVA